MQQQQQQQNQILDKQSQKAWLQQLKVTRLQNKYVDEALDLVVESTVKMYIIFQELGIDREACRQSFRSDFEDELNQQNSLIVLDPSSGNKIVGIRIFRDLTKISQEPPKRENYVNENYFLKAQLNHELMEGVYCKDFKEKDYEVSIYFNVHPDYANRGLTEMMNAIYVRNAYLRNVKVGVNILFSHIMIKVLMRIKCTNPVILSEINLENRLLNGEKIFFKSKKGFLLAQEFNDEVMKFFGVGHVIEERKQLKLKQQQKNRRQQQPKL